jgi:hypothetical protein
MTSETNITYTSTKPAWAFFLDAGFWLGAGLTFGAFVTIGVLSMIEDAVGWLFGVLS